MNSKLKTVAIALFLVLLLVGAIGGVKAAQIGAMIEAGESFAPPPIGVTTREVEAATWESTLQAVGTAVATQEVVIAAEVGGTIRSLRIESGQEVEEGAILATLDASTERAQLASAAAEAELASSNLQRSENLVDSGAVSRSEFDATRARRAQAQAQVAVLRATIAKKTLRAPFAGRLGIREADLGEIVQPGTPIVTLQSIDPIFVEFQVPERRLGALEAGLRVRARSDAYEGETFEGTIETVNSRIEASSRSVRVRATFPNEDERLRPGMFLDVEVVRPQEREVLHIPNTAVMYAPYGDTVYTVSEGEDGLAATQVFVRLGERRGDLVEVVSGLEAGQQVVSTGAFKLQNGAPVTIENDVAPPEPSATPTPENR